MQSMIDGLRADKEARIQAQFSPEVWEEIKTERTKQWPNQPLFPTPLGNARNFLMGAFSWGKSVKGGMYWQGVNKTLNE